MSHTELSKQIGTLNTYTGHDTYPGNILIDRKNAGFATVQHDAQILEAYDHMLPQGKVVMTENTEAMHGAPLQSVYVPLSDPASWGLLERMSPGSVVGFAVSKEPVTTQNQSLIFKGENLGVVQRNDAEHFQILGWQRKLVEGKRVAWGNQVDRLIEEQFFTSLTEKQKVIAGINALFANAGVEGSQMAGIFNFVSQQPVEGNSPITTLGCYSHNDPMGAIGQNILGQYARPMGSYNLKGMDTSQMYLRIGVGLEGTKLVGTALPTNPVSEELLMYLAYEYMSNTVAAKTNIPAPKILETSIMQTEQLVERALNGGRVDTFQSDYLRVLNSQSYAV